MATWLPGLSRDAHRRSERWVFEGGDVGCSCFPVDWTGCLRRHAQGCHAAALCHLPTALRPTCNPAHPQELREQLRTLSKQLHCLDERLQFMEQRMGRRSSWLPSWGSG